MTMPTTRTVAGVREAPRHEIAGSGHRRCGVRYGDYMSGGTVKPDFWALSLSCILLFDLKSPFFVPTLASAERGAQDLSRTAR